MHRFFLKNLGRFGDEIKISDPEQIHQIKNILRLKSGTEIIVFDSNGQQFLIILEQINNNSVIGKILKEIKKNNEPQLKIILYQALLKKDNFEWVIKQGTCLGINKFVPVITNRSIVRNVSEEKLKRWQKISQEATEQSGRTKIPEILPPIDFQILFQKNNRAKDHFHIIDNMKIKNSLNLIAWENSKKTLKQVLPKKKPQIINLFIGPEGSFSEQEIRLIQKSNFKLFSFGPRILRAEFAGLAIVSAIFYQYQEF